MMRKAGNALGYSAAAKLIDKGVMPLCFFLYGPEDFLKEELVRKARETLISPGLESFNYSAFDLVESSMSEALCTIEGFPALGGARVVVVRNADRLKRTKKDAELLKSRLSNPPPFLCFLLIAVDPNPSSAFLDALPRTLVQVVLRNPSERDMENWISAKVAEGGLSMTPSARRLLLDLTGRSMWRASNEIEKLVVNAGDRKEITDEDVTALVGGPVERSPFALTDAVAKRDRSAAASVAADMLERGEAPVAMAGLLTWQLVRRWGSSAERSPAGASGLKVFRHNAVVLCEADHALKRSKLKDALAAQLMVDALTRPGT